MCARRGRPSRQGGSLAIDQTTTAVEGSHGRLQRVGLLPGRLHGQPGRQRTQSRTDLAVTAVGSRLSRGSVTPSASRPRVSSASVFCIRRVPGGGYRGGAPRVAVPERRAGSRTGGEDEVRSVYTSAGGTVDQNRLRFDAGFALDEHHAALSRAQARIAPRGESDDHRPQGTAEFGQHVLVTDRLRLVLAPIEQADIDQTLESAGQQARRNG